MKKNLLFFTCLLSVCFANAQFTRGQKMIGGQLGFSMGNSSSNATPGFNNKNSQASFALSLSKFTSPLALTGAGLYYSYSHYRSDIGGSSERTDDNHSVGLFVNRTKLEVLSKKFYFTYTGTAGANYQLSSSYYTSGSGNTDSDGYGVYISGGIGLMYQLNQRFLLTFDLANLLNISYHHGIQTSEGSGTTYTTKGDSFNLSSSLGNINMNAVSIGIRYLLK